MIEFRKKNTLKVICNYDKCYDSRDLTANKIFGIIFGRLVTLLTLLIPMKSKIEKTIASPDKINKIPVTMSIIFVSKLT